jgi:hypothetical protein
MCAGRWSLAVKTCSKEREAAAVVKFAKRMQLSFLLTVTIVATALMIGILTSLYRIS